MINKVVQKGSPEFSGATVQIACTAELDSGNH